jgi:hypothetical protein
VVIHVLFDASSRYGGAGGIYIKSTHTWLVTIFPPCPKIQLQNTTTSYRKINKNSNFSLINRILNTSYRKKLTPPMLKARVKLHNQDKPLRPVVNNMNAPSYKVAKHLKKEFLLHHRKGLEASSKCITT